MKKPLKLAGIFGIILIAITIISIVIALVLVVETVKEGGWGYEGDTGTLNYLLTIAVLIIYILSIGFLYGFVALGKRFNNKLLLISSWVLIVIALLSFVLTLFVLINGPIDNNVSEDSDNGLLRDRLESSLALGGLFDYLENLGTIPMIIVFIIIIIFSLAVKISFIIGIFKLEKNNVPLAKWCGIFEIVVLLISSLGLITLILETSMFFRSSKEFETEKVVSK